MRLWPVLLDSRPPYLGARQLTLLSAPLGDQTVFSYVGSGLEVLTTQQTLVVSPPGGDSQAYREQTAFASAYPIAVCAPEHFNAHLGAYELSDALLILDLRWVPADLCELGALLRQHRSDPRVVQHLVENEHLRHAAGEHVRFDEIGQVRAIQRHYRRATWSHIAAVSASIVPVACAVLAERREHFNLTTLLELRRAMSAAGLANRDLFHRGGVFHLGDEPGLLAANERTVLRARERGIDSRSFIRARGSSDRSSSSRRRPWGRMPS
jgi:hypothetical protein